MSHTAKYELVAHCVTIVHFWNRNLIKTATGGTLRTFVSYVFNIVTDEEDVDLEKDVRKCVKRYNEIIEHFNKSNSFEFDRMKLWFSLVVPKYSNPKYVASWEA